MKTISVSSVLQIHVTFQVHTFTARSIIFLEVKKLRDCTIEMLEEAKCDPLIEKRARHGITEDIRTQACVKALQQKDYHVE